MILNLVLMCQKDWLLSVLIGLVQFYDQIKVANWLSELLDFL